jgi:Uma2 family endonuclease
MDGNMTQIGGLYQQPAQQQAQTMLTQPHRHAFTVAQFEHAYQAGVFAGQRLELLWGEIIEMPPMGDGHVDWLTRLNKKLLQHFGEVAEVLCQTPLVTGLDHSEPEPDFILVKTEHYHGRKVRAEEAALVIEISDTTLDYDRTVKLALYAAAGVRELWIINVKTAELELYRQPDAGQYRYKRTLMADELVELLDFPGYAVAWSIKR